jgi:hypothetical protein
MCFPESILWEKINKGVMLLLQSLETVHTGSRVNHKEATGISDSSGVTWLAVT